MKVLFLSRSTLYSVFGGDSVQVISTAKYLRRLGVEVDIKLTNEEINYDEYDLVHVFNIIRPADCLSHLQKSGKPYVVSTIYVDFSEYERKHRGGLFGLAVRFFSNDQLEYLKAILRMLKNGEGIQSKEYLRTGHRNAIKKVAKNAALLLPNSHSEMHRFSKDYGIDKPYRVVYYGIDAELFLPAPEPMPRDEKLVICVARIEGKKNQLNLIKALNNTEFTLKLIGKPAPNHIGYYEECKRIAGPNIEFVDFMPQEELNRFYRAAKVHVLASWNETCGLSTLEAGYYGCNTVVTDKGDTTEYFGDTSWFCDPGDPVSILKAVKLAAAAPLSDRLYQKINETFNWEQAAGETLAAYETVLQEEAVLC